MNRIIKVFNVKRGRLYAAAAAFFCLSACTGVSDYAGPGVGRRLAENRSEDISDLHYRLFFNIPSSRKEPVTGSAEIEFEFAKRGMRPGRPFVLDFKGDSVSNVTVGGEKVPFRFKNEHILIDRDLMAAGRNRVGVEFRPSDGPLNRNEGFMYTLFVPARAREAFPCFDQPDLKGRYTLTLSIPEGWSAMSNAPASGPDSATVVEFGESDPLPTYLFAFTAGDFSAFSKDDGGFRINMFYRESDPYKVAQCSEIVDLFYGAIHWMENYTGIPFPFQKYDFAVMNNFQFGGMEHPGVSLFNDGRMFLAENAGTREKMARYSLVAHEVTHIWFGDYVTMKWFDDVWTKEVFANFFAAKMLKEAFPDVDEGVNFADYARQAYSVDRTPGTNAIKQKLDNLSDAGLLYGNIIYDKAPFAMDMLYRSCGEDAFRLSMRQYLAKFPFGNATWDDLIAILDENCKEDLKKWSKMWITRPGMPQIKLTSYSNVLNIKQNAAYPQTLALRVALASGDTELVNVNLDGRSKDVVFESPVKFFVPNPDARAYGCFLLDSASTESVLGPYIYGRPETERSSIMITLNENVRKGNIDPERFIYFLLKFLEREENPLLFSQAAGCLKSTYFIYFRDGAGEGLPDDRKSFEGLSESLWDLLEKNGSQECRKALLGVIEDECFDDYSTRRLLEMYFSPHKSPVNLSEGDLTELSFELAVRTAERPLPEVNLSARALLDIQRARITLPDRLRRFDFILPAVSRDPGVRDSLFNTLLYRSGRPAEPWASAALALLNHPLRERYSVKYIRPALNQVAQIQKESDIFFPTSWIVSLLSSHNSEEAADAVAECVDKNSFSPMLKGKILQNLPPYALYKAYLQKK